MNKLTLKIFLGLLTFLLGVIGYWSFEVFSKKSKLDDKETAKSRKSIETIDSIENVNIEIQNKRFNSTSRGCGPRGYSQSYITNDGYRLSEGAWETSKKEFKKQISKAKRIIKIVENSMNKNGEKGLRVLTENITDDGEKYFSILWYGNGAMNYISAPSLELALEFE